MLSIVCTSLWLFVDRMNGYRKFQPWFESSASYMKSPVAQSSLPSKARPVIWNSCVVWLWMLVSHVWSTGSGVPSESRPNVFSNSRYEVIDLNCTLSDSSQSTVSDTPQCSIWFTFCTSRLNSGSLPKRW